MRRRRRRRSSGGSSLAMMVVEVGCCNGRTVFHDRPVLPNAEHTPPLPLSS